MKPMPTSPDPTILQSLDGLLHALELEPIGNDRFRLANDPSRFPQLFGGQLVAHELHAMNATVDGLAPSSVHAYFVAGGTPDQPVELAVERVHDGRTIATRRVAITQGTRVALVAIGSFHTNTVGAEGSGDRPVAPSPEDLPTLQDWARAAPDSSGDRRHTWIGHPPPLEIRIGESPTFLSGAHETTTRSHWLRIPRPVGDNPDLHAVLLTYASDYFLLDMALRNHPDRLGWDEAVGTSLDHTVWLHRPVSFDRWHLYVQELLAFNGHRGLVQGRIYDQDGPLVATVAQEVLVRAR